ncbi:Gfo/Idh/MocA family oxidoreductase [Paenibacillus sp. MWE-103]|uniref:Gfo/Idh/MocA family oxidoreductase n=1 Tax=Paenibacillus artemisiicola TaxID=1172618 RepID=A0ABS3WEX6_9BACL|nr:Gfo/Idh/MocA family oxidoreductase [Paenibacillus artemisiicola]MBO7746881.1 Gfo/Idh/MocA family oxidoreductase [Paenibacillus artemisiicola]
MTNANDNRTLRVGLIGIGSMGGVHLDVYERLAREGYPVELTAICDLKIAELKNDRLAAYALYDSVEAMLRDETLDIVDITVPTPFHAELACSLLEQGYHVLCEKPMARTSEQALRMAEAAAASGRTLMIGQCLRFWPAYEYLKACVADGRYGNVRAGYFFRGSGYPLPWYLNGENSGGCLLDMHVHDTDIVNWLFGLPAKVSTSGRVVAPKGGYDVVSTNYYYPEGMVLNAQADWTLEGDIKFAMTYRVNLEGASIVFAEGEVSVHPVGEPGFKAELPQDAGYYREIRYFLDAVASGQPVAVCPPEATLDTMAIIEAEQRSAELGGELVAPRTRTVNAAN